MASSRDTLNGPDWRDVAAAVDQFQEDWGGFVALTISLSGKGKFRTLTILATVSERPVSLADRQPSASASVNSKAFGAGDFSQALLSALYELDKEVYRQTVGVSPIRR